MLRLMGMIPGMTLLRTKREARASEASTREPSRAQRSEAMRRSDAAKRCDAVCVRERV